MKYLTLVLLALIGLATFADAAGPARFRSGGQRSAVRINIGGRQNLGVQRQRIVVRQNIQRQRVVVQRQQIRVQRVVVAQPIRVQRVVAVQQIAVRRVYASPIIVAPYVQQIAVQRVYAAPVVAPAPIVERVEAAPSCPCPVQQAYSAPPVLRITGGCGY